MVKNQLNIPEFLFWGILIYGKFSKYSFYRSLTVWFATACILPLIHGNSKIKKQIDFRSKIYTAYEKDYTLLYRQYTITEYNFRSTLFIPFIVIEELGGKFTLF